MLKKEEACPKIIHMINILKPPVAIVVARAPAIKYVCTFESLRSGLQSDVMEWFECRTRTWKTESIALLSHWKLIE